MAGKVLIALHLAWFLSETSTLTGQFVQNLDNSGTSVCPGNASVVLRQSDLEKPNGFQDCIPSRVLCAWKCSKTTNCTRFNWNEKEGLCELFTYVPVQCVHVPGCVHFQVKSRTCGEGSCTGCKWTEFPMTQIRQGAAVSAVSSADKCKCLCLADLSCLSCTFHPGKNICRKHDSTTPIESANGLNHFQFECP